MSTVPTVAEYAADCERVAVATLVLKQGRFPTRAEVDAELRRMNEPSTDGITKTPVVNKADCAAFLKAHNVGTPNAAWAPPKTASKATPTPNTLPANPPANPAAKVAPSVANVTAPAAVPTAPKARPVKKWSFAEMKLEEARSFAAAATNPKEKAKWLRDIAHYTAELEA